MKKLTNLLQCLLFIFMIFYPGSSSAQNAEQSISLKVKAIPYALQKLNNPLKIEIEDNSSITILADKNTNLFNSPGGNFYRQNAPMLLFQPDSNFILKAKVTAELKEVYDVAALVIYHDKDLWAKLCFENSANKESLVVSVVTRKYSDDCNSFRLSNN